MLISGVFGRSSADPARHHRTGARGRASTTKSSSLGGSGPSFETIVASGPRSSWAHARPSSKPLAKNELVVLDHGAILRGYCSDMTRTVHVGARRKGARLYAAVLEAQQAAKAAIRPGVTAGEVDAAARGSLKRSKLGEVFHA